MNKEKLKYYIQKRKEEAALAADPYNEMCICGIESDIGIYCECAIIFSAEDAKQEVYEDLLERINKGDFE